MGWTNYGDYKYTSVAELKEKAERYVESVRASGGEINPVVIEGKTIAKSWWGKAWCENLERYADYYSRLERGRKYVKNNCVVDLQIQSGEVLAQVIGSGNRPYNVRVTIDELTEEQYDEVCSRCSSKIQNIDSLIKGDFPDDLKELFLQKQGGLFPSMARIHFRCSCPDVADMCKHVAAVLYAIGARFDNDPLLFFKLRGVDMDRLIGSAINDRIQSMLDNAQAASDRIISDSQITGLFGV